MSPDTRTEPLASMLKFSAPMPTRAILVMVDVPVLFMSTFPRSVPIVLFSNTVKLASFNTGSSSMMLVMLMVTDTGLLVPAALVAVTAKVYCVCVS